MEDTKVIVCTSETLPEPPIRLSPGSVLCSDAPLTVEEFCELADEHTDAELVEGVVVTKSPVSYPHQALSGFLQVVLGTYVRERRLGEVLSHSFLMRITEHTGREPDIMFVAAERVDTIGQNYLEAAADLVIEIVSPHDRPNEMVQKRVEYEQAGVKELWVIDQPRKRLSVFDLDDNGRFVKRKIQGNRLSARTVPGFRIQIDWLWCEPRQFPSTVSIVQDLLRG